MSESIGLYDVGTGASLTVEKRVELGCDETGAPMSLSYTTASHGRLVVIHAGALRCTYDVDSAMLDEDADRIGRWLAMPGDQAVAAIREHAIAKPPT